jgi:hypothetical protein
MDFFKKCEWNSLKKWKKFLGIKKELGTGNKKNANTV